MDEELLVHVMLSSGYLDIPRGFMQTCRRLYIMINSPSYILAVRNSIGMAKVTTHLMSRTTTYDIGSVDILIESNMWELLNKAAYFYLDTNIINKLNNVSRFNETFDKIISASPPLSKIQQMVSKQSELIKKKIISRCVTINHVELTVLLMYSNTDIINDLRSILDIIISSDILKAYFDINDHKLSDYNISRALDAAASRNQLKEFDLMITECELVITDSMIKKLLNTTINATTMSWIIDWINSSRIDKMYIVNNILDLKPNNVKFDILKSLKHVASLNWEVYAIQAADSSNEKLLSLCLPFVDIINVLNSVEDDTVLKFATSFFRMNVNWGIVCYWYALHNHKEQFLITYQRINHNEKLICDIAREQGTYNLFLQNCKGFYS